ncbi:hypothetical protein [Clostridium thermobutyricum]|uniref:hypothetical protein n=1 Tax=Clostridium thermobutyricum TaxID=29372 RepID=UPI003F520BE9
MIKRSKKIAVVIVAAAVIAGGIFVGCGNSNPIDKELQAGKTALSQKNYTEALKDFKEVENKDKNNQEVVDLINIIQGYENAKQSYDNNNLTEAENYINNIPSSYINYAIKDDINNLKNEISEKEKSEKNKVSSTKEKTINTTNKTNNSNEKSNITKEISQKITEGENLIKSGDINSAKTILNSINLQEATEAQKEEISNDMNKITNQIQQENQKQANKVAADKEKLQKQRKALEQKEEKSKNANDVKLNKKNSDIVSTSKNVVYTDNALGIKFTIPADWVNHILIKEYGDGIIINFTSEDVKEPVFMLSIERNGEMDGLLDNEITKVINGQYFVYGQAPMNSLDSNKQAAPLFKQLMSEANVVKDSLSSSK